MVAAATTAACLPLARMMLLHLAILDHASARSCHSLPTPRGGGLGVLAGVTAGLVIALITGLVNIDIDLLAIMAAVGALALTGFSDDIRDLGPIPRLVIQCIVGSGLGVTIYSGSSSLIIILGAALAGAAFVAFIVNVVNFMDGINGITALTMMAWGGSILWAASASDLPVGVAVGAVAIGTGLAFLPFNAPRAALFLGDVGSYLYGGLVASASVVLVADGMPPLVLAAPLIPYMADVLATLLRRVRRGAKLTEAHREHFYQRLTSSCSLPQTLVALAYGTLSLACGTIALFAPAGVTIMWLAFVCLVIAIGPRILVRMSLVADWVA